MPIRMGSGNGTGYALPLQAGQILLAHLGDFGRDDNLTVWLVRVPLEVILVVALRGIERFEGSDLRHNWRVPDGGGVGLGDDLVGGLFLFGRMEKDRRAVL